MVRNKPNIISDVILFYLMLRFLKILLKKLYLVKKNKSSTFSPVILSRHKCKQKKAYPSKYRNPFHFPKKLIYFCSFLKFSWSRFVASPLLHLPSRLQLQLHLGRRPSHPRHHRPRPASTTACPPLATLVCLPSPQVEEESGCCSLRALSVRRASLVTSLAVMPSPPLARVHRHRTGSTT
jgi:hypothetical protein